ncbi:1-acyl-sn-glycerol-3-phosphate acyltransferase [candidate division WS5 bacterium]|uniref:1-acyl-sn-glycerol-3-phosphate acyltransferase n=1 Tax=candidate division WS5 bacterium TaxID=2093353 RepID=A0A419DFN4_9BACT|nr:MAG: 1-acyl-sn-glycerol-3-phosphate acyltransferase [candidate division WS5 bacterium]
MLYWFLKIILHLPIHLFWMEKVEGKHNLPKKGSYILASNHRSFLDFAFLSTAIHRRIYYLAAEFLYEFFPTRLVLTRTKQVKVPREGNDQAQTYEGAKRVLENGGILGVFVEGKRSHHNLSLKAYKGAAKIALQNKADIVPTVIHNSFHVWGMYHRVPRLKRICKVKFLPAITYEKMKNHDPGYIVHDLIMPEIARDLGHEYEHRTSKTKNQPVRAED